MPTPVVIDISHYQDIPVGLVAARQSGIVGVIHKATESTGFVDKKLGARRWLTGEAGLLWGMYHFLRSQSAAAQVDHFVNTAKPFIDDKTMLVCDYEDASVPLVVAEEFMSRLAQKTGRAPVLYTGSSMFDTMTGKKPYPGLNQWRLWLAHYTTGQPRIPVGWAKYWLWQYSDKGNVPGINGPVDVNQFNGAVSTLIAEWAGSAEAAEPPVVETPPKPPLVVTVTVPEGVEVEVRRVP